ncbi:CHAT domain-containing protein [Geitlerinema sp. P-1104]|uniref:CHAT domain-containing tetratricopeptide repeat protein n=1 Tax=Geitlerinema sp. P-1104 TaxID=2546230 RepID=UPI0014776466|nr:CHAT domain-containing protein [Geitlerinema sp. P-1104]NMG59159.1 CHAT domain-containing protein [Geitlerinema sp. P-1104]
MTTPNNRVVLKLDGDLEHHGFKVFLEIGVDDQLPQVEMMGYLPANPPLAQQLHQHWQQHYRSIGAPYIRSLSSPDSFPTPESSPQPLSNYRIKPKGSFASHHEGRFVACQQSARQLAHLFSQWLQSPEFHRLDLCLREELSKTQEIELLIRCDRPDIKKLPWHLWSFSQRYQKTEVSFGSLVASSPYVAQPTLNSTVKILAILGHAQGINTQCDRQFLETLPQAAVEFLVEPSRHDINHKLWQDSWDIVFFAGHSETRNETGKIYINPQESLEIADLSYGFQDAVKRGLTLAIFNSCDGLGLVQKIEDWQIPMAIVMRELVPDQVAQAFLKSFLAQFSQGQSFRESVRHAREQLQGLEGQFPCASWLPMIYQNCPHLSPTWQGFIQPKLEPKTHQARVNKPKRLPISNPALSPLLTRLTTQLTQHRLRLFLLLFTLVLGQVWLRPSLANYFHQKGQAEIETPSDVERPWVQAKRWFRLALHLDPNHCGAHVDLGNLYQDMSQNEQAEYHYRRSFLSYNAVGCNNLSRLYILQDKFEAANTTLIQCERLLKQNQPWTQYSILKNRGWVALQQESYRLSQTHLQAAIELKPNEGAAHCLMAKLMVKLPDLETSQLAHHGWTCVDNIRNNLPEEIRWKTRVQHLLDARGLERE